MQKQAKRVLSLLIALVLIVGYLPVNAFADDGGYVAKIGEQGYTTLANAMNDANQATGDVTVEIYGKVSTTGISLNNNNITKLSFEGKTSDAEICLEGQGYVDIRYTSYPVTYTDLTLRKDNGNYGIDGRLQEYFSTYNGGEVTYNNCSFPTGVCAMGSKTNTTVTFNNCTFNNTTSGKYSLWVDGNGTNVVVNGGSFTGVRGVKLYAENGVEFSTLNVSNAIFYSSITEKAAVVLTRGNGVTLSNNTYSNNTNKVEVDDDYASDIAGKSVTIEGTEYVVDSENLRLNQVVQVAFIDTDKDSVKDDSEIGFTSLQNAIIGAVNGDTITLLNNIDLPTAVVVNKNVTLNLNGKTLTVSSDTAGDGVFHVTTGATLTISGEGTVNGKGNNDYNMAIWADGGNVVINGGTYTNEGATATVDSDHMDLIYVNNNGSVTINGGTFICETPQWTLNKNDNNGGTITVKGGTFVGYDPSNSNTEPGGVTSFLAANYAVVTTTNGGKTVYEVKPTYNVTITTNPSDATVVVRDAADNVVVAESDGSYKLTEGAYRYTVSKSGYYTKSGSFTVRGEGEVISVTLSKIVIVIPTTPSEKPTTPSEKPTDPSEEPTDPSEEPTNPTEEPTDPSEEPTDPSEEPTDPSEEPTDPTEEPTNPTEEPTDPSEEPTNPSEEPTDPSEEPTVSVTVPINSDENSIHVDASVSGDKATIDKVDLSELDSVIGDDAEKVGTVTIDFSGLGSSKPITTVEIPADVINQISQAANDPNNDAQTLQIVLTDGTSIEFDAKALSKKVAQAKGDDITISILPHDEAELTSAQEEAVGDNEAYDVNVTSGGQNISNFEGTVTLNAYYELKPGQKPEGITVWYVDENGNRKACKTQYNSESKSVSWTTTHLSLYMIGYDEEQANTCPKDDTCPISQFTDANVTEWYHDGVHYCIEKGLMKGTGNNKFEPDGTTTRAQIVTILWRLAGEPKVDYTMTFVDVEEGQWYTEAIRWAASTGVVEGYGNGTFGTNDKITREQFATILWRYENKPSSTKDLSAFPDADKVSDYAKPAMAWIVECGIIKGMDDGTLNPQGDAIRAQAATILMRYIEKIG